MLYLNGRARLISPALAAVLPSVEINYGLSGLGAVNSALQDASAAGVNETYAWIAKFPGQQLTALKVQQIKNRAAALIRAVGADAATTGSTIVEASRQIDAIIQKMNAAPPAGSIITAAPAASSTMSSITSALSGNTLLLVGGAALVGLIFISRRKKA